MEKLTLLEIKKIFNKLCKSEFELDWDDLEDIGIIRGEDFEEDGEIFYEFLLYGLNPERLERIHRIYSKKDEEVAIEWKELVDKLGNFELVAWTTDNAEYSEYSTYKIYHFKDHDIYIKIAGSYSSYSSYNFQSCIEVEPKQVEVTQYLEKK